MPEQRVIEKVGRAIAAYQGVRYDGALRGTWDGMASAALEASSAARVPEPSRAQVDARIRSVIIGSPAVDLPACESCGVIVSDIDSHWETAHQDGKL